MPTGQGDIDNAAHLGIPLEPLDELPTSASIVYEFKTELDRVWQEIVAGETLESVREGANDLTCPLFIIPPSDRASVQQQRV